MPMNLNFPIFLNDSYGKKTTHQPMKNMKHGQHQLQDMATTSVGHVYVLKPWGLNHIIHLTYDTYVDIPTPSLLS